MSNLPTNPYAPPASNIDAAAPAAVAEGAAFPGPLYSQRQIGVAAFFGSIFAGVLLMQANYRVMGKRAEANRTVVLGLLGGTALMAVAAMLPDSIPSTPLNVVAALVFFKLCDAYQGKDINRHLGARGAKGSNWRVLGAVVVCVGVVLALMVAGLALSGKLGA
jgi:hypothetical protein